MTLDLLPQTVHGKLCRAIGNPPGTVQLLVHGGTYSGKYWDLPYGSYSYQREMAEDGRATFAIDLLGTGTSSQPLSALLTGTSQASVVHQVVTMLRNGQVLGLPFDRIVLVGHSMGSGISIVEATSYHDVDGVVLTGMTHSMDAVMLSMIFVDGVHPAILDPLLSGRGSDAGYITTIPGARHFFYDTGAYEQGVLNTDEATKDQVSSTMIPDLVPLAFTSTLSRDITVPVLMANGTQDTLFCAFHCTSDTDLLNSEAPYFTSELDVYLLPNAGHSLALATGAPAYRSAVDAWLTSHFE